jgi:uncharacterized protein (DUF302 family)
VTPVADDAPAGVQPTDGIQHRRSPHSHIDTVHLLIEEIEQAGAKLFVVVDHSGEAKRVGLALRNTKLLVFGSPIGGTPVMERAPTAALDLPLKILVWEDDAGAVWMTYLSASWLAHRYGLSSELTKPLSSVEALASRVAASR